MPSAGGRLSRSMASIARFASGALREHSLHRQRAQRQAHPALADMVVERLADLEAAAAHVADQPDRPEETRDDPERRRARLLCPAEHADLKARLRPDFPREFLAVLCTAGRLGGQRRRSWSTPMASAIAETARRQDRPAKIFRVDRAVLGELLAESAQRFFVEARDGARPSWR